MTLPPVIPSQLDFNQETEQYANIYLQDVYKGLEPHVKQGEIKRIRVVREMPKTVRIDPEKRAFGFQFPVISCGATYAGKTVLGEIDIEADGSAFFKVPANVPIYFMVLDKHGRALQRMRSFTHLMPGETQGCVGCHESRHTTPLSLSRTAYAKAPKELEEPDWGVTGFDYTRLVQPVLDRYCVECHQPGHTPNGIDLTGAKTDYFNVSYDILARQNQGPKGSPYVNWIPTYNGQEQNILVTTPLSWGSPQSRLANLILNGHPDKKGNPRVTMDTQSIRRILAWIDLNVPYYGSSETAYPEMTGCRRIYPDNLDKVLHDVAERRCTPCHQTDKIPRSVWTRITDPQYNTFLTAPLAKTAGGDETCGKTIFKDKSDPDYQLILSTFDTVKQMLAQKPRIDMPGGKPDMTVNRACK
jgi:Hydrazine synthase alpha subunit middle domain